MQYTEGPPSGYATRDERIVQLPDEIRLGRIFSKGKYTNKAKDAGDGDIKGNEHEAFTAPPPPPPMNGGLVKLQDD